jgi:hypothetical protein
MTLLDRLLGHDWFHEHSDDHRVWQRGRSQQAEITRDLKGMNCPFSLTEVRMTCQNMILEDFKQAADSDWWYREPLKNEYMAGVLRTGLIERARAQEIKQWFAENENVEAV